MNIKIFQHSFINASILRPQTSGMVKRIIRRYGVNMDLDGDAAFARRSDAVREGIIGDLR